MTNQTSLVEMAADIAAAYVSAHEVATDKVSELIRAIHGALAAAANGKAIPAPLEPAVPIKKSITNEHIFCLEDGKPFRSLKRHLRTKYNLTPEEYRAKWGLPSDYPMVAPSYAQERSALAIKMGSGAKRTKTVVVAVKADAGSKPAKPPKSAKPSKPPKGGKPS